MSETTALICAGKISGLIGSKKGDLSNLKLQKLVYYSQAWHLGLYGSRFFPDPIEAWIHGPVVRSVFAQYKYGNIQPIECDPINDAHVIKVCDLYGSFDGAQLERMTHNEKPWIEARIGLAPDTPSKNIISVDTMRDFYSRLGDG